jgi:peptidoglycan/LPS O-acetylase OafA/YrhL
MKMNQFNVEFLKSHLIGSPIFVKNSKSNWLLIRLFAAFAVIYGHSFGQFPAIGHQDLTIRFLTQGTIYSGQIAVVVFFFISGALVTGSLINSTPVGYFLKRITRIFPALFVCLLITSVSVKVIFPSANIQNLFTYVVLNIMNTFNVGQFTNISSSYIWEIPSVFIANEYQALNGSLWTLPQEFRLYFFLLLISFITASLKKRQLVGVNVLVIFFLIRKPEIVPWIGSDDSLLGNKDAVINSIFFLFGSIFYLMRVDRLAPKILLLASMGLYFTWLTQNRDQILFFASMVLFATFLAKLPQPKGLRLKNDYSYGVYLYGWPVAQILAHFNPLLLPEVASLLVAFMSFIIASLSWKFIEAPSINFSKRVILRYGLDK